MYVRALLTALLVLLCTPGIHQGAALAQNITVVIQGTTVAGPVPSVNIAGSYPSVANTDFVITNKSATELAQVTVDDGSIDTLWLKNTVIEARKANVSGTIEFFYEYVPGPIAPTNPPPTVRYETSVNGAYFSSPALNNEITLWGSIKNPPNAPSWQDITPAHYKKVTCIGTGCGTINPNAAVYYRDWNPFDQNRIIKGKITFVLKTVGNKIFLPSGIKVSSTEAGGGPDVCEPGVRIVKLWSSLLWTTELFKCSYPEKPAAISTNHERSYKFAKATWENLSLDLVRGNGEFVNSLATLMEVTVDSRSAFSSVAQDQYRLLAKTSAPSPEMMVDQLWTSLIRNHRE